MPLTEAKLRSLVPADKPYRVFDQNGIYIEVARSGGKWWRFKYYFLGKERRMSLGVYPDVSLRQARERRDDARKMLNAGLDPLADRKEKVEAGGESLKSVAEEWFKEFSHTWSPEHRLRIHNRVKDNIYKKLGSRPIKEISAADLLGVIKAIKSLDTARRALRSCGQIWRYAISTSRCEVDVTQALRGALPAIVGGHFSATTDPRRLGRILHLMDHYPGSTVVRCALRLAPLVFIRPGELRKGEWPHVEWGKHQWEFTASKGGGKHIVPLAHQSLSIMTELFGETGCRGEGTVMFPGARTGRAISDMSILAALRSLQITRDEMTVHGFRAVARTLLDEELGFRPDIIELQLAHAVKDPNGRAYNRTTHLEERRRMMQVWADYLDDLKSTAGRVSIHL